MKRKLADREQAVLEDMGADKTVNSGATRGDGDGRRVFKHKIGFFQHNGLFIEVKCTDAQSFTVKRDILDKAKKQALHNDDLPILVVDMKNGQKLDRFVVLGYDDFIDIVDSIDGLQMELEIVKDAFKSL